jgi:hypothetical protein
MDAESVRALVEVELTSLGDDRVASHISKLLVFPHIVLRPWDYGPAGTSYPCWSVLEHPASGTGIAYCEFGFGPGTPWGLVALAGEPGEMSMGMDCGWYLTFLDAYFESMAATDLPIWRVFKQTQGAYPGVAITEEAGWNATWDRVLRLRAADPLSQYHCSQSIQVRNDET